MARIDGTTVPDDLVPPKRAAFLAKCSRDTLVRWAESGKIAEYRRRGDDTRGRWYSAAECAALAPRRVK